VADLAVYDAMVILQWATLPELPDRQHATATALITGKIRLAFSPALLDEVRRLLFRPELQQRLPHLTPVHAASVIRKTLEYAEMFEHVPRRFSLPQHVKDDHIFDLAIEAKVRYLVTWENRILQLATSTNPAAEELRRLTPTLRIITPADLAALLRNAPGQMK